MKSTCFASGSVKVFALLSAMISPAFGGQLQVPFYWQSGSDWCWAASSVMVGKYYSQTAPNGVQSKPWWGANNQNKPYSGEQARGSFIDALEVLAEVAPTVDFTWNFIGFDSLIRSGIVQRTDLGHPTIILNTDNEHAFVVSGYSGTSDSDFVYVNDPSGALFKNEAGNSLCRVSSRWDSFFDALENGWFGGLDSDGYRISADTTGPAGMHWGGRATADLCPFGWFISDSADKGIATPPNGGYVTSLVSLCQTTNMFSTIIRRRGRAE